MIIVVTHNRTPNQNEERHDKWSKNENVPSLKPRLAEWKIEDNSHGDSGK